MCTKLFSVQNVPCHFIERQTNLCQNNYFRVKDGPQRVVTYHLFFENGHYICGPYWRGLFYSYDLDDGDTIEFRRIQGTNDFQIRNVSDSDMQEKDWLRSPGEFFLKLF